MAPCARTITVHYLLVRLPRAKWAQMRRATHTRAMCVSNILISYARTDWLTGQTGKRVSARISTDAAALLLPLPTRPNRLKTNAAGAPRPPTGRAQTSQGANRSRTTPMARTGAYPSQ